MTKKAYKSKLTLFETVLIKFGIKYTQIRIALSKYNGKVERQDRNDEQLFYKKAYFNTALHARCGKCTKQEKNEKCRIMAYEVERPSFFVERGRFSCLNMTSFVCVI